MTAGTPRRAFVEPSAGTATRLTQRELADRWRMTVRSLQRWHAEGYGPRHLRLGGKVLYRIEDILAFEARQLRDPEG